MKLIRNIKDKYIKVKARIKSFVKTTKDTIEVTKSGISAMKKAKKIYNEFVDNYNDDNNYQYNHKYANSRPQSFIDVDYVEVN